MLKKLKSALKSPKALFLTSTFKSLIFSGLLLLAGSHWQLAIFFVLAAFYFYFQSFLNSRQFFASFLILLIFSLLFIYLLPLTFQFLIINILFFGFLFFLLLGVKNLIFIRREAYYYLFNGLLILAVFIFFFKMGSFNQTFSFLAKSLTAFLAVFLLIKEFLSFSRIGPLSPQRKNLIAADFSFLILQFLWLIAFLPFSFLNAASLALLIALILEDFTIHHLSGTLTRQIILRSITLFVVLALVIFGSSNWNP